MKVYIPILYIFILASCQSAQKKESGNTPDEPRAFSEKHRPQYHFTPPSQWMNDPNGMVYYDGEYHLFYQHYPDSNVWGPMHWGHAVSKDMITWEHLPIAIYPDSLGLIFSGSAVIDWNNTSSFGNGETPPMIAIFTHHLMEGEKAGRNDFQYQSIAYSLDRGRTFEMYEGNPVIPNPGIRDFRDPKVIWHEETGRWVMVFSARDRVKFYTSLDLKNWEFASDFGPNQGSPGRPWECPDIFPLTAEDGTTKWVLIVSVQSEAPNKGTGTSYFIGDFDGKVFTNDDEPSNINWLDYGADNYAFVTWSDVPEEDGRRLGIGWMSNWMYAQIVPTTAWRSAMTLPRELRLIQRGGKYRLSTPLVIELSNLMGEADLIEEMKDSLRLKGESYLLKLSGLGESGTVELSNEVGDKLVISFTKDELIIDRTESGIVDFHEVFGAVHRAPLSGIELSNLSIFMDASSVEIFGNNGDLVMTDIIFPNQPFSLASAEGVEEIIYVPIKSIWD